MTLLIQHFLRQAKAELKKPDLEGLAPETLDLLMKYDWPGNVRQLRAVIRRCVLDTSMSVIFSDVLPKEIQRISSEVDQPSAASSNPTQAGSQLPELVARLVTEKSTNIYSEAMAYMERYVLLEVLKATEGNQSQAAEMLGITRGKLRDRINTYGIVLESGVSIGPPK